jgi:protein SCO1/2
MAETASPGLARFRMILWALVLIAAAGATALFLLKPPTNALGVTGKPFSLESTAGGRFTADDLRGAPSLVFFGYTSCPDVCPTTLADQSVWRHDLGLTDKDLRTLFVTVDPARDTKAVLTDYLSYFPGVVGLVGTPEETEAAKASFGAFSEKQGPDESGFYLVNHTALVYLMDRNGRFQGTIAYGEDKKTAEGKIKKLLET